MYVILAAARGLARVVAFLPRSLFFWIKSSLYPNYIHFKFQRNQFSGKGLSGLQTSKHLRIYNIGRIGCELKNCSSD